PTDSENMHDNSVSSGDSYLKSFLVGTGSVSSPSSGSLLASNLFGAGHRALLVLWWDEYDPSPILFYGNNVNKAFISPSNSFDSYSLLRLIEDNWGLSTLTNTMPLRPGLRRKSLAKQHPFLYPQASPISRQHRW